MAVNKCSWGVDNLVAVKRIMVVAFSAPVKFIEKSRKI